MKPEITDVDRFNGDDVRIETLYRAKMKLLTETDISHFPEEMAVLDRFLVRCWQMGWLEDEEPATVRWNPVLFNGFIKPNDICAITNRRCFFANQDGSCGSRELKETGKATLFGEEICTQVGEDGYLLFPDPDENLCFKKDKKCFFAGRDGKCQRTACTEDKDDTGNL